MPRPFRARRICCQPQTNYFKPRGIPLDRLKEVVLGNDELEAIRLVDLNGLYQEDAAKEMDVSRQTLGSILHAAHKKIAEALIQAKALKIVKEPVIQNRNQYRRRNNRRPL